MNLTISPVRNYSMQNTYNKRHIAFRAEYDELGPIPSNDAVKVNNESSENISDKDKQRIALFGTGVAAFILGALITGMPMKCSHNKENSARQKMINDLLQKYKYTNIYAEDKVIIDKDGTINVILTNKINGNVYNYDLINSRKYVEYPPKGTGIMHDYNDGKDYIKYEGIYVPAEEIDNMRNK